MLKGWKTRLVALALVVLGAVQAVDLTTIVPEPFVGIVISGIGLLMWYLRSITDTPAGQSE